MNNTYTEQEYADMFRWADAGVRTFDATDRPLAPVISIEVLRTRRERGNEAA